MVLRYVARTNLHTSLTLAPKEQSFCRSQCRLRIARLVALFDRATQERGEPLSGWRRRDLQRLKEGWKVFHLFDSSDLRRELRCSSVWRGPMLFEQILADTIETLATIRCKNGTPHEFLKHEQSVGRLASVEGSGFACIQNICSAQCTPTLVDGQLCYCAMKASRRRCG